MSEMRNMMRMHVKFQLEGNVRWDNEARVFVSICPALGISSQGDDREQAIDALTDAITQQFRFHFERGRLDDYLLAKGFHTHSPWDSGEFDVSPIGETYKFEVPLHLLLAAETSKNRNF